jgi:RNA polymerase sigma factor (sigma-70 family)
VTTLAEAHALVAVQARVHMAWLAPLRQRAGLDAEDLQQEVWIILGHLLRTYDPAQGPLAHYLRASLPWALRRVVGRASAGRFAVARPIHVQGQSPAWWAAEALHRGGLDEDRTALVEALLQLTPAQRAVVILHAMEGWSFSEVAARLGQNRRSVWVTWQRAAQRLRDYYRDEVAG